MTETNAQLVMENADGQTIRVFQWQNDQAVVVHRGDNRRVEIHPDVDFLTREKVPFTIVKKVMRSELAGKAMEIQGVGTLRLVTQVDHTAQNVEMGEDDDQRAWWRSFGISFIIIGGFMAGSLNAPRTTPALEEELKQHVVKIIKHVPRVERQAVPPAAMMAKNQTKVEPTKQAKPSVSVKRMGALGVLGRLSKSKQYGGVNLGAVKTSPGPGLGGGTGGSGGVQKTLYGKGIIAAPVGAGGNIKGAGGYGTKGKGGGQDGYGQLSLIGSSGSAPIPLGREAIIQGGLDRDMIAAVIQKNMGQIRFCYEQGLQGDPKLAGRVAVDFTIGGNGLVKIAGVGSTTLNSKVVEDCILLRLKSWKFPMPEGGVDVKVSYPFLLRRLGRG
ncbi:MAG: AgmX/PglI C-terminal domain-containing protein [Bdellovibrionaceae bacterium]|nr:AgmX/PglI C-terminal domain-containing protein [Bdellovibrionales bacterium]MCB9084640.1 AgmX/PglI C-terminal domain-containing protein [Pseudobdellovibrionaceae bacterium]